MTTKPTVPRMTKHVPVDRAVGVHRVVEGRRCALAKFCIAHNTHTHNTSIAEGEDESHASSNPVVL